MLLRQWFLRATQSRQVQIGIRTCNNADYNLSEARNLTQDYLISAIRNASVRHRYNQNASNINNNNILIISYVCSECITNDREYTLTVWLIAHRYTITLRKNCKDSTKEDLNYVSKVQAHTEM